jgi:hypothetical protein
MKINDSNYNYLLLIYVSFMISLSIYFPMLANIILALVSTFCIYNGVKLLIKSNDVLIKKRKTIDIAFIIMHIVVVVFFTIVIIKHFTN